MSDNSDNLSVNDFNKVCRTCLSFLTEGEKKFLYENCTENDCLLEMIMSVTFVQFTEKDGLPFQICFNCEKEIIRSYKFAQKCLEVDKKLKNCLKEFEIIRRTATVYSSKTLQPIEAKDVEPSSDVDTTLKNCLETFKDKIRNKIDSTTTQTSTNCQIKENQLEIIEIKQEIEIEEHTNEISFETFVIKPETLFQNDEHSENISQNQDESVPRDSHDEIEENSDRSDEDFPENEDSDSDNKPSDENSDSNRETVRKKSVQPNSKCLGPPYECKKCFKTFPTTKLLWIHYQQVKHPKKSRIACKVCSKSIQASKMSMHMRIHSTEKPYFCELCGRRFNNRNNLTRHKMIHSGEKPHKCPHCDKAFIQSGSLKHHLLIHTGEKPFICDHCGRSFATKASLGTHLKNLGDDITNKKAGRPPGPRKPENRASFKYECDVCSRRFNTKPLLNQHKLIHGEKNFLCSYCGRGFYTQLALNSHLKVHTGLKPYSCDICGKKFSQTGSLSTHKLLHTGDKPFVCTICNRRFTQRHHVTYHMRTHSGEKPHTCTVCGKSFALNGNLKVHVRTHTGETPYLCPICGKGFYDSSSMKKHKQGCGKQNKVKVKSGHLLNAS